MSVTETQETETQETETRDEEEESPFWTPDPELTDGDQPPAPEPEEHGGDGQLPVTTAFVVFQVPDGAWYSTHELGVVAKLVPERPAGNYDMTAGCACVPRDQEVGRTVVAVMQAQLSTVAQMQAAEQQEDILRRTGLRGDGGAGNRAARRRPLHG